MDDIFARIGLALKTLATTSTSNNLAEVHQLAVELQGFEGSINSIIDQRVAARLEALDGRLVVLEGGVNRIGAVADEILAETTAAPEEAATVAAGGGEDTIAETTTAADDQPTISGGAGTDTVSAGEPLAGEAGPDTVTAPA